MQKKIIASLLVSPMALTAMANINVSNGIAINSWNAKNGAILSGIVTGNKVSIPVGVGAVVNSFTAPAPGTYKVAIGALQDCGVKVSIGETELSVDMVSGGIQFVVPCSKL